MIRVHEHFYQVNKPENMQARTKTWNSWDEFLDVEGKFFFPELKVHLNSPEYIKLIIGGYAWDEDHFVTEAYEMLDGSET